MTEEERERERKKKAELELLLLDRKELAASSRDGGRGEKGDEREGESKKNMNVKKKKRGNKETKGQRSVQVDDERFSDLYTRPGLFPLDPTNPKYKPDTAKQIIRKRNVVQERLKDSSSLSSKSSSLSSSASGVGSNAKEERKGKALGRFDESLNPKEEIHSLVASIKRKTRNFETSDPPSKRPRT